MIRTALLFFFICTSAYAEYPITNINSKLGKKINIYSSVSKFEAEMNIKPCSFLDQSMEVNLGKPKKKEKNTIFLGDKNKEEKCLLILKWHEKSRQNWEDYNVPPMTKSAYTKGYHDGQKACKEYNSKLDAENPKYMMHY
jgi:hypothetical protein